MGAPPAPYLALLPAEESQRKHDLREVFSRLRYLVKTGVHWRMLPYDLPPWPVVYQQMWRWMEATLAGLRFLAFACPCLMLHQFTVLTLSP